MEKKKKNIRIFSLYMAVTVFGGISAAYSDTILQCILLVLCSVFTFVYGIILQKYAD